MIVVCVEPTEPYGGMGSNHVFNYSADTKVPNAFFSQSLAQYQTNSSQDAFQGKVLAGSIGKPLQYALSLLAQNRDVLAWGSLRIQLPAALIFSLRARITRNHSSGRLKPTGWTRLANEGHAFVTFVILQSVLGECNQSTRPPVGAVVPDGHACLGSINLLSFARVPIFHLWGFNVPSQEMLIETRWSCICLKSAKGIQKGTAPNITSKIWKHVPIFLHMGQ